MHSDGQELALARTIRGAARPLRTAADLDPLLERIGDARFALDALHMPVLVDGDEPETYPSGM